MRLPKSLNVFGQLVKVEFAELDPSIGGLSYAKGLIQINSQLERRMVKHVLLHEFFHSVISRLALDQNISLDTEEMLVDNLSKCLLENFDVKLKPKK